MSGFPDPFSITFPGLSTMWGDVGRVEPGPWAMSNEQEATNTASAIAAEVESLRDEAEALAEEASEFIEACKNFTATVPSIQYVQPTYVAAQPRPLSAPAVPAAFALPAVSTDEPDVGGDDVPSFTASATIPAPTEIDPQFPEPPNPIAVGAEPAAPALVDVVVPDAPGVSFTPSSIPQVTGLGAPPSVGAAPTIPTPSALPTVTVDAPDFSAQIARLRAIAATPVRYREYESVVPSVFEALAGVLSDRISPARADYLELSQRGRVEAVTRTLSGFTRRGHPVSGIDATMQHAAGVAANDALRSANAADELWRDDARIAYFGLAASAHNQAMEISRFLVDNEFSALTAYAEAQLTLVAAVAAAYDGALAALEIAAAGKELEYASEEGRGATYEAYIDRLKALGRQNQLRHAVFVATERTKRSSVELAESNLRMEQSKVAAFEAQNQAVAAQADAVEAQLIAYKGRVAAWAAKLTAAGAAWAKYSARMAAVRAKNQATATRVEAGSAANSAVVAQAQAAAAGITAELARYTLGVTQRRADLAYNQTVNRAASLAEDAKTAAYRRSVTSNTIGSTAQRVEIEGTSYGYKAASRFFDVATNAAGRAAEMTQSANEQLTRAYAVAQEAAGRALAALEAGKYSQLRTSVSLGASGSLGASSGGSRSTGTTLGWNVQEGWTQTESEES